MGDNPELTVVLPVYNEAGCIGSLIGEIAAATTGRCVSVEIIVVNDASQDGSADEITTAFETVVRTCGNGSKTTVFSTRQIVQPRRMGQSVALLTGFRAAHGSMILSMDADGQYDPAEIPRFLEMMATADMVCGWRANRSDGRARRITSLIANAVRNMITGDTLTDAGCTFRIMRAQCREAIGPLEGRFSGCEFFFHPLFIRLGGFTVKELPVAHRPRKGGSSHYHLVRGRWYNGLVDSVKAARLAKSLHKRKKTPPVS
ncbi:MAG: glycosyltransferase [Chitinispirillaceae bacterium]|nr:glycosyltransferase [Chitinispirillaceae bacterium]